MSRWSDNEIQFLKNNSHLTYSKLAKLLNRTKDAVRFQFRQNKIVKIKAPHKKYSVNEEFFQTWTTEMAYILGIAFADGSIRKRQGNSTSFRLCNSNFRLLEQVREVMKSNHKISIDKRTNTDFELNITRLQIVEDLEKLGMTENNSLTMKFPYVPDKFFFVFVRGYFDGDGYVKLSGDTGRSIRIVFASGSKSFLTTLKEKFEQRDITCSMRTLRKGEGNESYQLSILKDGRKLFYHGLYGPDPVNFSGIKMERKYHFFIRYFERNVKSTCEDCGDVFDKRAYNHVLCTACAKERDKVRKRKPDGYKNKRVKCPDCSASFVKQSHNHLRCNNCSKERERLQKNLSYRRSKE